MKKAAIVACSDGRPPEERGQIGRLAGMLEKMGYETQVSPCLYRKWGPFSGSPRQRADALMSCYRQDGMGPVFDVSGGDLANGILPFLDYEAIGRSGACLWGYSDLTAVLNAVYARTGRASVLYQLRNLLGETGRERAAQLEEALSAGNSGLFDFSYTFVNGDGMEGVVLGGNLRCLLKLAGTPYWPDLRGKILLLEARSGGAARLSAAFAQLSQLGAFAQVSGVLLGTFTQAEKEGGETAVGELLLSYTGSRLCVAKTDQIGHGSDAKAVRIGGWGRLEKGARFGAAFC